MIKVFLSGFYIYENQFPRAAALIAEEQPTQRAGDLETCCYHFIS